MSDHDHVEPRNPPAEELATRSFRLGITLILSFIAVVFYFIL